MRKIPTLYVRNDEDRKHVIVGRVSPGCEWVLAGEGKPTRKLDGTCTMLDEFGWWARREVKPDREPPEDFIPEEHDPATGKTVGWEPIYQSPFAKFHAEALAAGEEDGEEFEFGTYELVGPKINGNNERLTDHTLARHGEHSAGTPTGEGLPPEDLMMFCRAVGWEGLVWHHPDGRMAKLKVRDIAEADRAR